MGIVEGRKNFRAGALPGKVRGVGLIGKLVFTAPKNAVIATSLRSSQ